MTTLAEKFHLAIANDPVVQNTHRDLVLNQGRTNLVWVVIGVDENKALTAKPNLTVPFSVDQAASMLSLGWEAIRAIQAHDPHKEIAILSWWPFVETTRLPTEYNVVSGTSYVFTIVGFSKPLISDPEGVTP